VRRGYSFGFEAAMCCREPRNRKAPVTGAFDGDESISGLSGLQELSQERWFLARGPRLPAAAAGQGRQI
jgi:hypothetical protein